MNDGSHHQILNSRPQSYLYDEKRLRDEAAAEVAVLIEGTRVRELQQANGGMVGSSEHDMQLDDDDDFAAAAAAAVAVDEGDLAYEATAAAANTTGCELR